MKLIAILISTVVTLSLVASDPLTWGNVGSTDTLLARDVVSKKSQWLGIHNVTLNYPPNNQQSSATLTGIRLWDFGGTTNFGFAHLVSGGPGYRNATIELISQAGKSLYYTVEYYGHY